MLGKQHTPLPANSVQKAKETTLAPCAPATAATDKALDAPVNYVSDDKDDNEHEHPPPRRSRRTVSQRQPAEGDSLQRIVALAAKETAVIPPLAVEQRELTRGYASANLSLQLDKWAYVRHILRGRHP